MDPIQVPPPQIPAPPPLQPAPPQPHSNNVVVIVIAVLFFIFLASTVYLYFQNNKLRNDALIVQNTQVRNASLVSNSITPSPTETTYFTANWKTYTNKTFGFELKYPNDYLVLTENPVVSFGFGVGGEAPSPYLNISNFYTVDLSQLKRCDSPSPGQFCLADGKGNGQAADIVDTTIDNLPSKSFYMSGGVDTLYHIIQTTGKKFELKMYVAGGGLEKTFTQILSTFKFLKPVSTISPTSSPLLPSGWMPYPFPAYGLTLYAPSNWKSDSQDFPQTPDSLIRFWQGSIPDAATIQLDIKTSWANTGDAPYQPKNYTVDSNIAAVKVDPPQKNEKVLDRYQTNVYFEHGTKTYVFSCVHNWIPEQYQLCDTMLKTLQFTQ